jgi:hypothetical protein
MMTIAERVHAVIAEELWVDILSSGAALKGDLGADSMDALNLTFSARGRVHDRDFRQRRGAVEDGQRSRRLHRTADGGSDVDGIMEDFTDSGRRATSS